MTARARIPGAAPAWVLSVLAGPRRAAPVVHRGAHAVYLDVDGTALGVLSAVAAAVPCAVRTALPVLNGGIDADATASVGGGRMSLGAEDVVVVRTVDASVPPMQRTDPVDAEARLARAVGDRLRCVRAELPASALEALADGRAEAVTALLGRGSGLTPVGDDVLAGWIATAVAACPDAAGFPVSVAVAGRAPSATTLLSATLIDCARRGDVLPEFRTLLLDLAAPDRRDLGGSARELLAVGHTSGAGLLLGTLLAFHHLASRRYP